MGHRSCPKILNPAAFIVVLKIWVFLFNFSIRLELYSSSLYASSDAPTMDGAIEFEKRYVLALFLRISTTYLDEAMKPPEAPPIDLPNVELIKSIFP